MERDVRKSGPNPDKRRSDVRECMDTRAIDLPLAFAVNIKDMSGPKKPKPRPGY